MTGLDFAAARQELRAAELALMQQREAVAQIRRDLPPGPVVDDYTFDSPAGPVTLAELVGVRPLVVYHFMFGGPLQPAPCPMCAMWADGWDAVVRHLEERLDFVVATHGSVADNEALAAERGWGRLRLLSAVDSEFKHDLGSQDDDGNQWPFFTVFERDEAGAVRLSWSGGAQIEGEHWRGVDLLSPVWHFFDLTRAGRGDWMPSLS